MGNKLRGWYKPQPGDLPYAEHFKKKKRQKKKKDKQVNHNRNKRKAFYKSREWKEVRYKAFVKYGNQCMCCGCKPEYGCILQVDHIKPRHKYPELALDINNLQILCASCNRGKYGDDETDWRMQHMREIVST